MLGTHGIGVSVPMAAAVADATVGLAIDRHIPNGAMLTIGWLSEILALGFPAKRTVLAGKTVSAAGVVPILHFICALLHTYVGIISLIYLNITCFNIHFSTTVNLHGAV